MPPQTLTPQTLTTAVDHLVASDTDFARVHDQFGPPPLLEREPSFVTLIHMILEQQVSLASAKAALDKLLLVATPLTPETFLALDDDALRAVGFSRQKTRYGRHLAQAILDETLELDGLQSLSDEEARAELCKLKGIGPWTADVYLLMVLRRPDVWPIGDRALVVAAREVKGLEVDPTPEEMEALGELWRPYRAVAARLLWHHYLNTTRQKR